MAVSEKHYLYKSFRDGVFLGIIQNVTSPFRYTLQINNAGSSMEMVVGTNPDDVRDAVDELITESGDTLITEDGDTLVTERPEPIFGNETERTLIRNGNDIEVYEVSSDNPTGKLVFSGYISKYAPNFGGDGNIKCTVLSYGVEMDQYLIQGASTIDADQATGTDLEYIFDDFLGGGPSGGWNKTGQSWIAGGSATNLSKIIVKMKAYSSTPADVTLKVYDNSAQSGTPLATATRTVDSMVGAEYEFAFASPITLIPGGTYYFGLYPTAISSAGVYVYYKASTNPYANGTMWQSNYGGGSGGGSWAPVPIGSLPAGSDLYFQTYYTAGATDVPFTLDDPANIVDTIVSNFNSQGGHIDIGDVDLTGLSLSYTFKINTILEGVKKCLDLSPSNWYWYVNPATSLLYFKETPTAATHTMILGRHMKELDLEVSIENLKNIVYFSGGDAGAGENLFVRAEDSDSLDDFPQGIARISDNRVTLSGTADALMDNFLDNNSSEDYIVQLKIPAIVYDISLFNPGDTVGFGGFGNFVDFLILQIVSLTREANIITLNLGMLPKRASAQIEAAQRSITDLQTVNNPANPS